MVLPIIRASCKVARGLVARQHAPMLRKALVPLIDFAYPPRCPSCGAAIATGDVDGDDALCSDCWAQLEMPGQPACAACRRPFAAEHLGAEALCAPCLVDPPRHSGIAAATIYGPVSREMILGLKHGGRIASARRMGRMMAAKLGDVSGEAVVVPVPLHRWRLWRRGYNQSMLLARMIARTRQCAIAPEALCRVKRTPSLGGLNPAARARALSGAIVPGREAGKVSGRSVVLVDDVVTSGATSDSCVSALLKAGARDVLVACFARVIEGEYRTNENARGDQTPGDPILPVR